MYKVSTGEARTDLYDINKGLAQVADLSITRENQLMDKQIGAAKQAAKKKQEDSREDDIMRNLAIASKVAIRPNDQQYFANQQQGVYDYVEKNIDKLKTGDPGALMEFQRMYGKLTTEAEMSKNAREFAETEFQKYNANSSKYRADSDKKIGAFIADPKFAGNWDVSQIPLKENIDYRERMKTTLNPIVDDILVKNPLQSKFTETQAKELIKEDVMSDPTLIDQANYEYEQDKSKGLIKGDIDPVDYFANKNAKFLTRSITGSAYYTGFDGGGNANKAPKVVGTYATDADGKRSFQFEYKDKTDNPYIAIPDPQGGGGVVEVKPYKVVYGGGGGAVLKVLTKDGVETEVNYSSVKDIMNNKFGISNVYELESENTTPSNVEVTRVRSGKKAEKNETKSSNSTYDANTEAKIKAVMDKNKASRETVIAALKKAGKIK